MKFLSNVIALLILAAIGWGLCKAAVPAIDAELNAQAATAREYQQVARR
jgi:hypothetical protein